MSNSNNNKEHVHITSYKQNAIILVVLLVLTYITVFVANINFGKLSLAVAMIVASVKATTVSLYFMHLKYEKPFIRNMVLGVFALFAIVLIITFFDYSFR